MNCNFIRISQIMVVYGIASNKVLIDIWDKGYCIGIVSDLTVILIISPLFDFKVLNFPLLVDF